MTRDNKTILRKIRIFFASSKLLLCYQGKQATGHRPWILRDAVPKRVKLGFNITQEEYVFIQMLGLIFKDPGFTLGTGVSTFNSINQYMMPQER